MTRAEIIDQFVEDLRISLSEVNEVYYGLNYWYSAVFQVPEDKDLKKYLERYHERVFCYELYHKMRTRMETHKVQENQTIYSAKNIFLQSELIKVEAKEFIEKMFQVEKLSKEFMPDFLLHTPGNFDNQLVVMEVKSTPKLSFDQIKYDLLKIQEFINRYRYIQGIFIATNISESGRNQLLESIAAWLEESINTPERIKLIFRSTPFAELYEYDLSDL